MRPSLTLIISCLFGLFVLHSIYSLFEVFRSPKCSPGEVCYSSYLNSAPDLDLYVFVSDNSKSGNFELVLKEERFNYFEPFEKQIELELSRPTRNNGSLFIHTIITPSVSKRGEVSIGDLINSRDSVYIKSQLTKYAVPESTTFNLLQENKNRKQTVGPVTHLRSKYAVIMCTERVSIPHNNIPFEIVGYLRINSKRQFLPLAHQDVLQMRIKDLKEITLDTKQVNVTYIYNPVSLGKIRFYLQIAANLRNILDMGFTEKEFDEVKGIFADTNFYLLAGTLCIGSIHMLLDFLTFKSDVSFWRSQKSMAGLSTRAVLWRAFSQTIIFLYLSDEGTSLLVLVPCGIATIIEFWKVMKVLKVRVSWKGIKIDKDSKETVDEKKTREYDEESMKYLSYILYPLCVGAAVYSLMYQPHKSWYSWTINSLVNAVYAFGFLFMLPQLFINYKLKSVAALPWQAFTYRAFNTIIDDIFAFIITMPMAHRVACFRDDVVFLIYLYQRWLYPVDKTRVDNIAGESTVVESEGKKEK